MLIRCSTKFDITVTGVKGNFNRNRIPFRDESGQLIDDQDEWVHSRNQQRNWETINQLLALRVLPIEITRPEKNGDTWTFEFEVEQPAGLELQGDPLGTLKSDCKGVPMITGLTEKHRTNNVLIVGTNIFFDVVNAK